MFATFPTKTSEKSQLVMLAGTRCRSTYGRIKPPTISASDPAAAHPATRRAVRAPGSPAVKAASGRSLSTHEPHATPAPFRQRYG